MYPSFGQFTRWAGEHNVLPLWIEPELPAKNLLDWVHTYAALKSRFFFLHSAAESKTSETPGLPSDRQARYSYFALESPRFTAEAAEGNLTLRFHGESGPRAERLLVGNPFTRFAEWLKLFNPPRVEALPPFWGGAVGYMSYDSSAWLDPKIADSLKSHRRSRPQALAMDGFPAFEWGVYDAVGVIDHARQRLWLVHSVFLPEGKVLSPTQLERLYRSAQDRLRRYAVDVQRAIHRARPWGAFHFDDLRSNRSEAAYRLMVRRAKGFITAGDLYQVNLAQTFSASWVGDPWALYRRLTHINPSPYASLWRSGTRWIVSSSPELLVRQELDRIETRPIAGTYPRKPGALDPLAVGADLARDTKERAEHIMLVDLERNDLGRVCIPGSIQVAESLTREIYSHVVHLVSDIHGILRPGLTWLDALKATFPGGTITGCPKLRSMELINRIEPQRRGLYTGSLGWIGFSGDMTLNILIRSFFLDKGHLAFPVGAGIVADSDSEREYKETLHKAAALLSALHRQDSATPRRKT